jgi:arylsulfatase
MKAAGYATGHFGKNHLGDRNEYLPTVHGFDEFFGNLYHLNTEDYYEQVDYQHFAEEYSGSVDAYNEKFGARGVLHAWATEEDDDTVEPRWGRVGKQRIEDTGPLSSERMKNFDDGEVVPKAFDFMQRAQDDGKPFFVWLNTTRMHLYTRLNDDWRYAAADATSDVDFQGSGMLQHDHDIGRILDWLDEQGLAENTIVWYSTDNGPEHSSWPHGATTPFRGEKMTTYEGGIRMPSLLRWPGKVDPGRKMMGLQAHYDMFTSLAKAAGIEDVNADVMDAKKQYIDGVDQTAWWTGEAEKSARNVVFHYDELNITALRIGPWKWHIATAENYYAATVPRGKPLLFNIHLYGHLVQEKSWLLYPTREIVQEHLKTLIEYPPTQGGSSFNAAHLVEEVLKAHE